jgi:hypothetical protein
MNESTRFLVDGSRISDEMIDGEMMIINLVSGNYYSLVDSGADIWMLVRNGATYGEIGERMRARYEGEDAAIQQDIAKFVGELQEQGLVTPTDAAMETSVIYELPASDAKRAYEAPKLNVYIDMQKMLLLDPIHEVDERGWPSANKT